MRTGDLREIPHDSSRELSPKTTWLGLDVWKSGHVWRTCILLNLLYPLVTFRARTGTINESRPVRRGARQPPAELKPLGSCLVPRLPKREIIQHVKRGLKLLSL